MFLVLIRFRKLQRLRFLQLFYTNFREQVKNSFEYPNIGILSNVIFRSSRPEVFCQKGILRNLAKFTGKHCGRVSLLINLQASLKGRLQHRCFPVNFAKFLRTPFSTEQLWATASEYWNHTQMKQNLPFLSCLKVVFLLSWPHQLHTPLIVHYKLSYYSLKSGCKEQKNFKLDSFIFPHRFGSFFSYKC